MLKGACMLPGADKGNVTEKITKLHLLLKLSRMNSESVARVGSWARGGTSLLPCAPEASFFHHRIKLAKFYCLKEQQYFSIDA